MGIEKSVELNEKSDSPASVRRRFFVALLPSEAARLKANEVKGVMRDQYASKAAFRSPPHVTLLAPFEWPVSGFSRLSEALSQFAATQPPVPMTLDGFGVFSPHVIYINAVKSDRLMTIQPKLLEHLEEKLGLVSKRDHNRAFVPHMTVAFRDLKPNMFRKAWSVFQHEECHFDFTVAQLTLLAHDGKMWTVKENYDFVKL
ncbi:MAG: 2'-5' RNA ligase family protein [Phormidesmis sp.]